MKDPDIALSFESPGHRQLCSVAALHSYLRKEECSMNYGYMGPQDVAIHRTDITFRYSSPSPSLPMVERVVPF